MNRFSIIMPTFNQGHHIRTAVMSVLDQREVTAELIVYDALSSDATAAFLETVRDRITWIREKDRGQVDAVNRGLRAASGELLAWLNSDDAYLPGALARVAAAFRQDPDLDFVYGDALEMDEEGRILTPNLFTEDAVPARYLFNHNYICQPTLFFRKRLLDKTGPLREDLQWTMDYEWLGRFFLAGCTGRRLPFFLAANRDYPQTKTNSGGSARYREMMNVLSSRPGPRMWMRRATWIYSFEAALKALNQSAAGGNALAGLLTKGLGRFFLPLVQPRSRQEIIERFHAHVRGKTLAEIWDV